MAGSQVTLIIESVTIDLCKLRGSSNCFLKSSLQVVCTKSNNTSENSVTSFFFLKSPMARRKASGGKSVHCLFSSNSTLLVACKDSYGLWEKAT